MSTATQGRSREHRVSLLMQTHGWRQIMRAAASKGPADLLMAHPVHGAALVQVGTASKNLSPADRVRLCDAADLCGALPIVVNVIEQRGLPTKHRWYVVTRGAPKTWTTFDPFTEQP
jgi:hypothetical protein